MMEPSDLSGAKKLALGKSPTDVNVIKRLLDIIYNNGASGALSIDEMIKQIDDALKNVKDPAAIKIFGDVFHCFTSENKQPENIDKNKNKAKKLDGATTEDNAKFAQIVGKDNDFSDQSHKKMGIFTLSSPFLSPAIRNAERCEIFLNSIPSIHASRMVPYLDVEFAFNREVDPNVENTMFGMTRFLLGGGKIADNDSATKAMVDARTSRSKSGEKEILTTTAGMEMFTSPQTLINMSPQLKYSSRYAEILDPTRPFASIESLTVNVVPTVGLYSQKKSTLVIKLHDRSRLSEVADLVRPQVYHNAVTAPTVWLTYGWRYPYEPGRTDIVGSQAYADFINNNMLVREAYSVQNSQFAFDQVGQVTITLELWTKGVAEMRSIRTSDTHNGMKVVQNKIDEIARKISENVAALGLKTSGTTKEIRAYQIIEAAENGAYPNYSTDEINKAISELEASFKGNGPNVDQVKKLVDALKDYYTNKDKQNLDLKQQVKQQAKKVTQERFDEIIHGVDPFLPSDTLTPDNKNVVKACNDYNLPSSASPVKEFKKSLCSFGKLASVFIASAAKCTDAVDEVQVFFHQFNSQAGDSANMNIAYFPIEMPVFFDQYKTFIEQRRSESMTIEEFLKLCIDAQLSDERNLAYGFKNFFKPYKSGESAARTNKDDLLYENKLGAFVKPQIEMYIETTFKTDDQGKDLLRRFELQQTRRGLNDVKSDQLKKIMRIHIFDKAHNPYETQGLILRSENAPYGSQYTEIQNSVKKVVDQDGVMKALDAGGNVINFQKGEFTLDPKKGDGYAAIKRRVSNTMPSIIYGANATTVVNANLSSKMDALMAVSNMQTVAAKSGPAQVGQPNGSGAGGLPLRIIPAEMTMATLGCPTLAYAQVFFVDFNTGTSADNIYVVKGYTHSISPGKFETSIQFAFKDAYARYEGAPTKKEYLENVMKQMDAGSKKK